MYTSLKCLSLSSHVKDEEVQQTISSEDDNIDEKVLYENADNVMNEILQELLQKENIN